MAGEYELTVSDYIAIFKRRGLHIAAIFLFIFSLTVVASIVIPPIYETSGTILIESQQAIITETAQANKIQPAQLIEIIKQRVLSRESLLNIIKKYQLFDLTKKELTTEEMTDNLRKDIQIDLLEADAGQWAQKSAFAFTIAYDSHDADISYKVTQELIDLFLNENVKERNERATETSDFLSAEAEKKKAELQKIEANLSAYKARHSGSLPQNMEVQMANLTRAEEDLRDIQRDITTTQGEIRTLEIELTSAKAGVGLQQTNTAAQPNPDNELDKLKAEYAKLSAIYSPDHPTLHVLQRKIDNLEKNSTKSDATTESPAVVAQNAVVDKIQGQIDNANARLLSLTSQEKSLHAKMAQLEGQVIETPQVEGELGTIMREYDAAKASYEDIKNKQNSAQMNQKMETENKGERFTLTEAPQKPEKPIKPNRKKILAVGFILALVGSFGFAFLMENIDSRVRGVGPLTVLLGMQPLVVIPFVEGERDIALRKKNIRQLAIAFIVLLVIEIIVVINFMPK